MRVAEVNRSERCDKIKENYYTWLLATNQEAKAAEMKEKEEDYVSAIQLYLKAGLPSKASTIIIETNKIHEQKIIDSIIKLLIKNELFEQLGDLYKYLNRFEEAKMEYRRSKCYRKVVDLCRDKFEHEVVDVEEEWGDWLTGEKQYDVAINHYIQAGRTRKAAEAAIQAKQMNKASEILDLIVS